MHKKAGSPALCSPGREFSDSWMQLHRSLDFIIVLKVIVETGGKISLIQSDSVE
jgi:hypothetical protein